jgi:Toprim-like
VSDWFAPATRRPVAEIAAALGRNVKRTPSADTFPCAACGAERRHQSRGDTRGACGAPRTLPNTWHCHACQAAGDSVDYAAHALRRARFRDLDRRGMFEVGQWFRDQFALGSAQVVRRPTPPPPAPEPAYVPQMEFRALWSAGLAVHKDRDCAAYLEHRGIDPHAVYVGDLSWALPWGMLPGWASSGGLSWARTHHRLIVPLYDAAGVMRSCLARSTERAPKLKSVAPRGYSRGGLVMANRVALHMLRGKARPDLVVIREGEIDFLVEATANEHAAVFGVVSGSWSQTFADRLPDAAHVVIATDADDAGDRYAAAIAATLGGRVVERRRVAA